MWHTFKSQQLKKKRSSNYSSRGFCFLPPACYCQQSCLETFLTGFYITYFPKTANKLYRMSHWSQRGRRKDQRANLNSVRTMSELARKHKTADVSACFNRKGVVNTWGVHVCHSCVSIIVHKWTEKNVLLHFHFPCSLLCLCFSPSSVTSLCCKCHISWHK